MKQPFSFLADVPVTLRRIPQDTAEKHNCGSMGTAVGIFHARSKKLVAVIDFDDLFDHNGNRFLND